MCENGIERKERRSDALASRMSCACRQRWYHPPQSRRRVLKELLERYTCKFTLVSKSVPSLSSSRGSTTMRASRRKMPSAHVRIRSTQLDRPYIRCRRRRNKHSHNKPNRHRRLARLKINLPAIQRGPTCHKHAQPAQAQSDICVVVDLFEEFWAGEELCTRCGDKGEKRTSVRLSSTMRSYKQYGTSELSGFGDMSGVRIRRISLEVLLVRRGEVRGACMRREAKPGPGGISNRPPLSFCTLHCTATFSRMLN